MFFFVYFYGGQVGVYFVGFVYGYVNGQLVGVRNKYLDDNRIDGVYFNLFFIKMDEEKYFLFILGGFYSYLVRIYGFVFFVINFDVEVIFKYEIFEIKVIK